MCSHIFAEGGGETKGEGKGKDSKHRSFYGGAEAWTWDEGEAKSRTGTLARRAP